VNTETQRFVIRPEDEANGWPVAENCREYIRRALRTWLPAGKPVEVEIRPFRRQRSKAQNRLFHAWMQEIARFYADHHGDWYSPEVWKEFMKRKFLGEKVVELAGEEIVVATRGTSDLTVDEFAEMLDRIDHWCGENLGLVLPQVADYHLAMGREAPV